MLTPTRELAMQLYQQFLALSEGAKMGIKVSLVLGGMDMMKQASELARGRPHVIVATPGRLMDLLQSGGTQEWGLDRCKYLVLDEADRLLTETFAEALGVIMDVLPPSSQRQTLLFSATLTPEIEAMAEKRLMDAKQGKGKEIKVEKIEFDAKTPPHLHKQAAPSTAVPPPPAHSTGNVSSAWAGRHRGGQVRPTLQHSPGNSPMTTASWTSITSAGYDVRWKTSINTTSHRSYILLFKTLDGAC